MRVGQTRRRDANERQIIDALKAVGLEVWALSAPGFPDLAVWQASGRHLALLEVKGAAGKLTGPQKRFSGPRYVVQTAAEALALFGVE